MKLWGARFSKEEDKKMQEFDNSLPLGKRYYREDIEGSMVHARMLGNCGIITNEDSAAIQKGLSELLDEIETGLLIIPDTGYEDIHSFVESKLTERIGDAGKKLHTARSRNDQVALDTKLYCKKVGNQVIGELEKLQQVLRAKGEANPVIMPGYTHLQRAQAVTFKYHLNAYEEMFQRDCKRMVNSIDVLDESPLGAGALAGTTHNIDREYTSKELGFKNPQKNFMDAVSDRDYIMEMLSDFSIIMVHLSRLSEELILWCSKEFSFIQIDDAYSTGSSMMPQKKNPDAAELIRGSAGPVFGSLMSILTTMKGTPLTYVKDMQLDKIAFMPALDRVLDCIEIMRGMIDTLVVNKEMMTKSVDKGFLNATELADYLVSKGISFRDAHSIVGKIVLYCEKNKISINEVPLSEFKKYSVSIDTDLYDYIDYKNSFKKGIKKEML